MSNAQSYPLVEFKANQAILATDPNRSQVVRVKSQSLLDAAVSQIRQDGNVLLTIDTLDEAIATDIASGQYVLVGGSVVTLDGGQAIYRVSDPSSGGVEMDNGNELMILFNASTGTAAGYDVGTEDGELPLSEDVVLQSEKDELVPQTQGRSINFMTYSAPVDENTIVLTPVGNGSTTLVDGDIVNFRATTTNSGAVTINGEATETVTGTDLPAGYIRDDAPTKLMWNGATSKFMVYRRIEYIEDAGRKYTLYENGLMTSCELSTTLRVTSQARGQIYLYTFEAFTFAKAFASTPEITPSVQAVSGPVWPCGYFSASTTGVSLEMAGSANDRTGYIGYTATGKWY